MTSNKELLSQMKAMEENSMIHRAYTKETLELIKDQTTKTNGRVDKLSTRVDDLEDSRIAKDNQKLGKKAVIAWIGGLLMFLIGCASSFFAGYSSTAPNYPQNGRQKSYRTDSVDQRRIDKVFNNK